MTNTESTYQHFYSLTGDKAAAASLTLAATMERQPQPASVKGLLTIPEAAQVLNMSDSGLRKLIARRAIRFSQSAKHAPIRFRREWLEDFIENGSIEAGAPVKQERRKKPKPYEGSGFADPSLFSI